MAQKLTTRKLADDVIKSLQPIDIYWLRSVYRSLKNEKERREWAKGCLENSFLYDKTLSPQFIGKSITHFLDNVTLTLRFGVVI